MTGGFNSMTAIATGNSKRQRGVTAGRWLGLAVVFGGLLFSAGPAGAKPFVDQLSTDFQGGVADNLRINPNIQSDLTLDPYLMLGSWVAANGPSNALYWASAVVHNGKVYVLGGKGQPDTSSSNNNNVDTVLSAIHYGNILPDGSVEKWDPDKLVTLPQPTYGHASAVVNGRLYVLGGRNANNTLDTVFWGKILGYDGSIKAQFQPNTWTAVASLPTPLYRPAVFQFEGRIYVMGGQDAVNATQDKVYFAPVQPDGNILPGSWQSGSSPLPRKLVGHSALVSNGYNGAQSYGRVYVVGGSFDGTPQGVQNQVYLGLIDPVSGDIPNWVTTTPLPVSLYDTAASISGGRIWVCGGAANGTAKATAATYYAGINQGTGLIPGSGQTETWTRGTDLPAPVKWHNLVTYNDHLIILGGVNNTGAQKQIYTTTLVSNNVSLTRWIPTTPLFLSPYGGSEYAVWSGHTAVVRPPLLNNQSTSYGTAQSTVYVIGGGPNNYRPFADGTAGSGPNTPAAYSAVYQSSIDSNGNLQTWSADPTRGQLPLATILHATSMAMNNQIYVMGGLNTTNAQIFAGAPSRSNVAFAEPDTLTTYVDPSSWYFVGKTPVFYETQSAGSTNSLGSFDGTSPIPILDANATTYCAVYQPLIRAVAVSHNDFIYVLGGISRQNTFAAPADIPLNPSGSVPVYEDRVWYCHPNAGGSVNTDPYSGGWQTTMALPQPMYDVAACVANDRLYIFGGRDITGTPLATVYFANFNSDGSLGPWTPTTAMTSQGAPYALAETAVVFTSGRLYVLGGSRNVFTADDLQNAVIYCTPDPATGSIPPLNSPGGWRDSTTLLDAGVAGHAAVVNNGFIYILGGRYNANAHVSSAYLCSITDLQQIRTQAFAWEGAFERYIDLDRDQYLDNLDWLGNPNNEGLQVKARYGKDQGPWTPWCNSQTVAPIVIQQVARYVHYKITMQTLDNVPGGEFTPILNSVTLNYAASKKIEEDSVMINHNKFDPQVDTLMITYKTRDQDVANVILRIYNLQGEMIRRYDIDVPPNAPLPYSSSVSWDGTNENGELVANGVYIIQYNSGDTHKIRKVVVFKR
jgi:N-acetylneuraminic acid mutarotase